MISSLNFKYLKRQLNELDIKKIHYCDNLFSEFDLNGSKTTWSHDRCKVQLDLYNFAIISYQDKKIIYPKFRSCPYRKMFLKM